jgi:outer membrane immunogenic protein
MSTEFHRTGAPILATARVIAAALPWLVPALAQAADIAVPPPPPTAPVNYFTRPIDWSGIYFGVNGGYVRGTSDWTNAGVSTGNFNTNGGLAGGTFGINYASGGFLFGAEGDFDWSWLTATSSVAACTALGTPPGTACRTRSDWLSTLRLRVGYAFNHVLFYGTGGAAIGDVEVGLSPPGAFHSLPAQLGWTAGGGIEYAFTDYLTAKVEYLFVDLGTISCPVDGSCGTLPAASVSLTENLVRAGVNYKFTW